MPGPTRSSHSRKPGRHSSMATKEPPSSSYPEFPPFGDYQYCMPPLSHFAPPTFDPSNEFWDYRAFGYGFEQHEGWSLAQEQGDAGPSSYQTSPPKTSTSLEELNRLSSRPYSTRASDPNDFASIWESAVVPVLTELLQKHSNSDFAVDVHNFPEMSGEAVPRVIYITLTEGADIDFEQLIRVELSRAVPSMFNPVYLRFRKGSVQKSSWWGHGQGERDSVCEPRNIAYREFPMIGMSIGPVKVPDAASLGGLIRVGSEMYGMSAFHAFEDSTKQGQLRVLHPARPDFLMNRFQDADAQTYSVGAVAMYAAPSGTLRPSLTFRNTDIPRQLTMVEMDWCLIGPVSKGKNVIAVPSFNTNRDVTVETHVPVEGNTEVYAMARTSGYSLGYTSDVPGLQRISGCLRREWTVRQYSPFKHPKDSRAVPPWQTLKQWVTSGIGVPGDSGAWLIRRTDNALMGLIWGRNHNRGQPAERVRLTYFTPIIDILDDVRENHAEGEDVFLPVYAAPRRPSRSKDEENTRRATVRVDLSYEPWSVFTRHAIQQHRQASTDAIQKSFAHDAVPASGALSSLQCRSEPCEEEQATIQQGGSETPSRTLGLVESSIQDASSPRSEEGHGSISTLHSRDKLLLGMGPSHRLEVPELSSASSSSSVGESSDEARSTGFHDVCIVDDDDDDGKYEGIANIEEPVRAKASFAFAYPELLRLAYGSV
ncbi:hypothetical protein B0T22DRAFT_45581 [Podospora appendiculata]|uniref:Uncharacterized protein n=1 Tax=Podospora appendiculata TaxID=314037 RepID=A0AAE1CGF5_9PEZI|nr:hypothetical protein B0T22DRAFT_45581 [Podospora appendiculata]